ncbi:MAG: hypothetical protein CMJ52_01630 [Planctomycetaceae bacterium]|nr:hypothetical protein [Planctomycetaceae bacterium]
MSDEHLESPFRVPLWASLLGWVAAVGFMGFYFHVAHAVMRGLTPSFGLDSGAIATATFGTIAMGLGIVWLVFIAELPEMWFLHRRPHLMARDGRCPACGHPVRAAGMDHCGECGVAVDRLPPSYAVGWRAVKRFSVALLLGFLAGTITAEVVIAADERSMRSTIRSLTSRPEAVPSAEPREMTFTRRWPASFSSVDWSEDSGFQPVAIFSYGSGP